jgi:hypothetical protein
MTPILGIMASQISGHLATPNNYESIATTTLSSGATTITFSSIPSTYKHLQIRTMFVSSALVNPILRFNSDTGANYSWHHLYGDGASVASNGGASATLMYFSYIAGTFATNPAVTITDVLDYANTSKYKTARTLSGYDSNGNGEIAVWSGNWRNTAAITSITLYNDQGNFNTNSSFALYGVK